MQIPALADPLKGVNVCIYGINRSLEWTSSSIRKKIVDPLLKLGISINLYAALNVTSTGKIFSSRSGELDLYLAQNESEWLPDFKIIRVDQDAFDSSFDFDRILRFGDSFGDGGSSIVNMMRALNALKIAYCNLPQDDSSTYHTIFLRPDLDIIDDLNIDFLLSMCTPNSIVVPNWHFFGGVNDRFAVCSPGRVSELYANRLDYIYALLEITKKPFHSEKCLYSLLHLNCITILPIVSTRFVRIRAGGALTPEQDMKEHLPDHAAAKSWSLLTKNLNEMHRSLNEVRTYAKKLAGLYNSAQIECKEMKELHELDQSMLIRQRKKIRLYKKQIRRDQEKSYLVKRQLQRFRALNPFQSIYEKLKLLFSCPTDQ